MRAPCNGSFATAKCASELLQLDLTAPEDVEVDERRNAGEMGAGVELPQRPRVRLGQPRFPPDVSNPDATSQLWRPQEPVVGLVRGVDDRFAPGHSSDRLYPERHRVLQFAV